MRQANIDREKRHANACAFLKGIIGFIGAVKRRIAILGDQPGAKLHPLRHHTVGQYAPPPGQVRIRAARSGLGERVAWKSDQDRQHEGSVQSESHFSSPFTDHRVCVWRLRDGTGDE